MAEKILEIRNLCKFFAGVKAVDCVDFSVVKGSCHCIVGENGAGKSTLIKVLTGAHLKTRGNVLYKGNDWCPSNTKEAMQNGIGCLFQELNVVEKLRVEEYISLGQEEIGPLGIIKKTSNKKAFDVLNRIDSSIQPKQYIEELSVAKRQIVEMAKALALESEIIIMDEPTAALTEEESKQLFTIIEELKRQNITIIYISHRLEEILQLADYITVMRDGKHVVTLARDQLSGRQELIKLMTGKILVEGYLPNQIDEEVQVLELKEVNNTKLHDISFVLRQGEILGFYGLIGSGKTEIARAIFGADKYKGQILFRGQEIKKLKPGKALSHGIALVPEERRSQGVCVGLSISSNIPMMNYRSVAKGGIRSNREQAKLARDYIKKIGIACRNENQTVEYLSGGNQQKVVLAKCLNADPQVLLLDEPTRGVDVGAKQEIYRIIRQLVTEGCSAIVFSSELPEILSLCDRIGLLFDGRIVDIIDNDDKLDSQAIMHEVTGGGRGYGA